MLVSVSTAFLFALITAALIWFKRITPAAALAVWLCGFTVASTGLSGPVNSLIAALVSAIGSTQ
ncbi:hypothetical protein AB0D08_32740 [Kitasatospora sp. NPDC048540]|uniref:hypothetical protein n=1 Tax=Kitasatospora sp. NPDC048540 TaxID=3155634 RepID=UPI0033DB0D0E